MKLFLKTKSVLDEREMLELYRIEHGGLRAMYALLCAVVIVQMLLGADFAQMAGELLVIAVTSVALIIAYARKGIWDVNARPSARGNAAYAALSSVAVALIVFGRRRDAATAMLTGGAMFALCFLLLTALMRYLIRRQEKQERELDE